MPTTRPARPRRKPQIAICGKMGAGKTTLARALAAEYGIPVVSFAAPLKEACAALGLSDATFKNRAALQDLSKYCTDRDDAHFVKQLLRRAPDRLDAGLVIDDLRRPIEYAWARSEGLLLVRLLVGRQTQLERGAEEDRIDHPTETALDLLPDAAWDLLFPEHLSLEQRVQGVKDALRLRDHLRWREAPYGSRPPRMA